MVCALAEHRDAHDPVWAGWRHDAGKALTRQRRVLLQLTLQALRRLSWTVFRVVRRSAMLTA
jgi:hypothetical protein